MKEAFSKREKSKQKLADLAGFEPGTFRMKDEVHTAAPMHLPCAHSKCWGLSGSEDRGGGDSSIQFINFGRVGDKSFEEWRQKIGGWKGG